jgi:hypothetical protein
MSAAIETVSGLCAACGVPLDSQYFDDSSVQKVPKQGAEIVLARFDLPPQYCGVLKYFAQFTDAFAKDSLNVETPGIEWKLLVNNHALFPYINLRHIVNPWGFGSFEVNIRLDEGSTIEMVARIVEDDQTIEKIGGRIVGRFWYNPAYGG